MKCLNCQEETVNPKFCNRSCSASYHNKLRPKKPLTNKCVICLIPISSKRKYCSLLCANKDIPLEKHCTICKTLFPNTNKFFYPSTKTSLKSECKSCFNKRIYANHKKQKQQAVSYKGNKCLLCGYDKCIASLDFHHLDPSKKDFGINTSIGSKQRINNELDKCILVCANCHREIHYGLHPKYLIIKDLV